MRFKLYIGSTPFKGRVLSTTERDAHFQPIQRIILSEELYTLLTALLGDEWWESSYLPELEMFDQAIFTYVEEELIWSDDLLRAENFDDGDIYSSIVETDEKEVDLSRITLNNYCTTKVIGD